MYFSGVRKVQGASVDERVGDGMDTSLELALVLLASRDLLVPLGHRRRHPELILKGTRRPGFWHAGGASFLEVEFFPSRQLPGLPVLRF